MLVAGMIFQTIGLILFTRISPDGSYLGEVLVPSLLVAIGIGFAFVPVTIAAVAGVAPGEAGLASGLGQHLAPRRGSARAGHPRRAGDLAHGQRPASRASASGVAGARTPP